MPKKDTTEKKQRRKERKQKEEEERQQRETDESTRCERTAFLLSVPSAPSPIIFLPDIADPNVDLADPAPYDWEPAPDQPHFDTTTLLFMDEDDTSSVPCTPMPLNCALRDFSALRSETPHPWRTIRRRTQRLLPQRSARLPFPRSLPKWLPIPPQPTLQPTAAIHSISENRDDPIPVLVMPRPAPLPIVPYDPLPLQGPVSPCSLPAETAYGPVQSGLALVCAREHPWVQLALGEISAIAWGSYYDTPGDCLADLPPDQLVFLAILVEITSLEPVFSGFLHPVITDFANTWAAHCSGVFG
ncbi:hypothetical protein B0H10DRAFT_2089084 [Mycena sp. CBHHK59/15]|nr:hypothetical protein B0H10DRAFT_2131259 [Mycena sp. CBHHK59/15]KAJ6596084.1 hypothetical protein B0H10DRAFT_2089084 [Mycena sp. CBHHK59/15]